MFSVHGRRHSSFLVPYLRGPSQLRGEERSGVPTLAGSESCLPATPSTHFPVPTHLCPLAPGPGRASFPDLYVSRASSLFQPAGVRGSSRRPSAQKPASPRAHKRHRGPCPAPPPACVAPKRLRRPRLRPAPPRPPTRRDGPYCCPTPGRGPPGTRPSHAGPAPRGSGGAAGRAGAGAAFSVRPPMSPAPLPPAPPAHTPRPPARPSAARAPSPVPAPSDPGFLPAHLGTPPPPRVLGLRGRVGPPLNLNGRPSPSAPSRRTRRPGSWDAREARGGRRDEAETQGLFGGFGRGRARGGDPGSRGAHTARPPRPHRPLPPTGAPGVRSARPEGACADRDSK